MSNNTTSFIGFGLRIFFYSAAAIFLSNIILYLLTNQTVETSYYHAMVVLTAARELARKNCTVA